MSDVILRILSIIGILLLALLGLALLLLLLLLFFPVTYRVKGEKSPDRLCLWARADWLFGVLRVRYAYPEPGKVTAKLLWKTLVDISPGKEDAAEAEAVDGAADAGEGSGEAEQAREAGNGVNAAGAKAGGGADAAGKDIAGEGSGRVEQAHGASPEAVEAGVSEREASEETEAGGRADADETPPQTFFLRIFAKIKKIKYTILKIYDRIKEIWENISYYIALLQDENTARLWSHVKLRIRKVLKNIRPRRIRANVTFGTGAPDTTGYVLGVYGMMSPFLGSRVCVTPDFTQAVLEGDFDISGHITVWACAWNALKLLLDRKLHLFLKKMKYGRKEDGR